jgi:hypothetical protein
MIFKPRIVEREICKRKRWIACAHENRKAAAACWRCIYTGMCVAGAAQEEKDL